MGNKKKRSKTSNNEDHSSSISSGSNDQIMPAIQNKVHSADLLEIKKESDIKQEPVSFVGLVEVPASTYRNVRQFPGCNERHVEYDFDNISLDEVKIEAKKECDDKKEKESKPKTNGDSGEEVTRDQQNQQPSSQGKDDSLQPGSGNIAHHTKKRGANTGENLRKQHKCNICKYSTSQKGHLNRHLRKHTGEKPHGCHLCPKRFQQKPNLRAHMKVHVEEYLFNCSACLLGFDGKDEKTAHEVNCTVLRYECHLCKESFGSLKTSITNHMRVHSGDKPFECKTCSKQFTQTHSLNIHMKLHAGPRPFRCSKCHQSFSQEDERNVHEEKCNRRVFECYVCGKSFGLTKSHLINHIRIHSGEKPFRCEFCQTSFTQKSHLKSHLNSVHNKHR